MDNETEDQVPEVAATTTPAAPEAALAGDPAAETLEVQAGKLTPEQALDALRATRREAAARRTENQRLRQEQQETTQKLDRATRQMEGMKQLLIQNAVSVQAGDFVDPLGAYARIQAKIETDAATGLPTNITQLLDALRTASPELLKPTRPRVGVGNGAKSASQPDESKAQVEDILRRAGLKGSPSSPFFDHEFAAANGGGVYVSPFAFREDDEGDE